MVQMAATLSAGGTFGGILCADESERKALDFNLKVSGQLVRLLGALAFGGIKRYVMAGKSRLNQVLHEVLRKMAPNIAISTKLALIDIDDIEDVVEDPNDIPEFWFEDGQGKPYLAHDRRKVWCYERCMSNENPITLKDIYNPAPWNFEDVDHEELRFQAETTTGNSEAERFIEDEEDEW